MQMPEIAEALTYEDGYDVILALVAVVAERFEQTAAKYENLSVGERIALHLNIFDSEVSNGGFHQFFSNSSGNYVPEIQQTLRLIGSANTFSLLEQALQVFPAGLPLQEPERIRKIEQLQEEQVEFLHRLSNKYYEQQESIFELGANCLKKHRLLFE